jgi:hypothetical protein
MRRDMGEGDEMSATAAGTGTGAEAGGPDARRRALFVLLRAELAAARTRLLDAGCAPHAVSRLVDERISLLSADCSLATAPRTGSPHGRDRDLGSDLTPDPDFSLGLDDVQYLRDDPVERGGIGQ